MKRLNLLFLSLCLFSCTSNQLEKGEKGINPFYQKALFYRDTGQADSAFLYFIKAEDLAVIQKDSLIAAKSLINQAILHTNRGDYLDGQEFSLKANSYLKEDKKENHGSLSSNYNNLGIATQNLRDYSNAIKFFDKAIKFSDDPEDINIYLNNKAYLFQEIKQYKKALQIYTELQKSVDKDSPKYEKMLANSSFTKWLIDSNYNPLPELLNALHIREREQDLNGLNANFAYLSDYYINKNPDSALFYAQKMYATAKKLSNSDDQLYALQKLIKLSPNIFNKKYFDSYLKLDDSAQIARNTDKNQFALIRYGVEENKADNLRLQKENTEKRYQLITTAVIATLLLIGGLFWYRKRKQRLQLEAQNAIQENKLRTSKKVHDVVANGLYRVMTEIENQEHINKEHILDKIEDMYEKSRDISYDQPQALSPNFNEKISELLSTFISSSRTVKVVGNTSGLWNKVSTNTFYEVEHILQELMVNMKKHSEANQVTLQFKQENNQLTIDYTDNGIGIQKDVPYGNGLKNTETRIKNISGTITFEPNTEKGLRIKLSFPIS